MPLRHLPCNIITTCTFLASLRNFCILNRSTGWSGHYTCEANSTPWWTWPEVRCIAPDHGYKPVKIESEKLSNSAHMECVPGNWRTENIDERFIETHSRLLFRLFLRLFFWLLILLFLLSILQQPRLDHEYSILTMMSWRTCIPEANTICHTCNSWQLIKPKPTSTIKKIILRVNLTTLSDWQWSMRVKNKYMQLFTSSLFLAEWGLPLHTKGLKP